MSARLSRRGFLIGTGGVIVAGGATAVGVDTGVLPGRSRLRRFLGLDGDDPGLPALRPGYQVSGEFVSQHRGGRMCGWTIAYPGAKAESVPVVIVLHGKGGTHASAFGDNLGLDRFLRAGGYRFALASVDGGDTYWHHRASGEDAGAMVTQEFLPLLDRHGLITKRIGFLGWSMGGFGSLWLAGVLGSARVAAVAAESPAIWRTAAQTAPGAFDDPQDFAAHDVFTHTAGLNGVRIRIDCGTDDGFYPAARAYAASLTPSPSTAFVAGAHDQSYWRRAAAGQLAFLAESFQ